MAGLRAGVWPGSLPLCGAALRRWRALPVVPRLALGFVERTSYGVKEMNPYNKRRGSAGRR